MKLTDRFKNTYVFLAATCFHVFCLFVLLNGLAQLYLDRGGDHVRMRSADPARHFRDDGSAVDNGRRTVFQLQWFDYRACRELSQEAASRMLDEFCGLRAAGLVYQPWVQFSDPVSSGRFVNIGTDERGFLVRKTVGPAPDPALPTVRIFAFGGSTTFGLNVPDDQTWPSHLSVILNKDSRARPERPFNVEVVNYGRNAYYPSQETVLLQRLLMSGHRPSLAIFMDGVNLGDAQDLPNFVEHFRTQSRSVNLLESILKWRRWPFIRLLLDSDLRTTLLPWSMRSSEAVAGPRKVRARYLVERFEQNQSISESVCALYGVRALFFLQPNTHYHYDQTLFRPDLRRDLARRGGIYKEFYARIRSAGRRRDLSGLFEEWGSQRRAVVDKVHYSPAFNRFLAERVAAEIDLDSLTIFPSPVDVARATGLPSAESPR